MSAVRDMYVGIHFKDEASNAIEKIDKKMDGVSKKSEGFGKNIGLAKSNVIMFGNAGLNAMKDVGEGADKASDNINDMSKDMDKMGHSGIKAGEGIDREFDKVEDSIEDVADSIEDTERGFDKAGVGAKDFGKDVKVAERSMHGLEQMAMSLAKKMATVFALDKIKDFGVSMIEESASLQAVGAQFEQVFGNAGGLAQQTVDKMGSSFGMVPNRIKPAFTQMTSMFKGLGLDTKEAMKQAEIGVTLAADAAAFYDKSYEDANSSLNSFIKGNYEGGESIGLFANETQLAGWAAKNLNTDWKKLDEAGKQMARLEFAKAMQEAAGATGQAARESDGYENQLGNVKQAWADFKAALGEPILGPAVEGLKTLTGWLQQVNTDAIVAGMQSAGDTIMSVAVPAFNAVNSGLGWISDNKETIIAATAGIVGGFVAFNVLTGISATISSFNTLMAALRSGTVMATIAQWGLNAAMLANPMTWVAVGIGAVIAAGVLLWQNWDTVKAKANELWGKVKEVFGGIYDWGVQKIQPVVDFFKGLGDKVNAFKVAISNIKLPDWMTSIGSKVSGAISYLNGSHATGLASVPFDGYKAELHKDEAVLTAQQSNALRSAGILSSNGDGTPKLNMEQSAAPVLEPSNSKGKSEEAGNKYNITITVNAVSEKAQDIAQAVKDVISDIIDSELQTV